MYLVNTGVRATMRPHRYSTIIQKLDMNICDYIKQKRFRLRYKDRLPEITKEYRTWVLQNYLKLREMRKLKAYAHLEAEAYKQVESLVTKYVFFWNLDKSEVLGVCRRVQNILKKESCLFIPEKEVKLEMINPDIENHLVEVVTDFLSNYKTKKERELIKENKRLGRLIEKEKREKKRQAAKLLKKNKNYVISEKACGIIL